MAMNELTFTRMLGNRNGTQNKMKPWEWPKERDLLYNTDLYVPLNLQLKGIPEEGEDLAALLDKTMKVITTRCHARSRNFSTLDHARMLLW